MSFSERAVEVNKPGGGLTGGEWDKFAVDFPNIYSLFKGVKDEKGFWSMGPASLIIYVEGDQMKCCVSPSAFGKVYFTSIPDVLDALGSLESQLQKDHGEWKARKAKR